MAYVYNDREARKTLRIKREQAEKVVALAEACGISQAGALERIIDYAMEHVRLKPKPAQYDLYFDNEPGQGVMQLFTQKGEPYGRR